MIENLTEARDYAQFCLKLALDQLRETGSVMAAYHVISESGNDVFVVPDGSINDPDFKDELSKRLRKRIEETNAHAYVMVSDVFFAKVDANDPKAVLKDRLRQQLGMTIEQGGKAGLLEVAEGVIVLAELRTGDVCHIKQEYLRDPANSGKVAIVEEPQITESTQEQMRGSGRFFGMFAPAAPGSYHRE